MCLLGGGRDKIVCNQVSCRFGKRLILDNKKPYLNPSSPTPPTHRHTDGVCKKERGEWMARYANSADLPNPFKIST